MKPVCLTIAGSDSSAGAGIQADLKTFASLGCFAATVITALTAQNTCGVRAIQAVDPDFVAAQLDAVLSDLPVTAVKIGMLANKSIVKVVAAYLSQFQLPVVLDPVLTSSSGMGLFNQSELESLKQLLFPICRLVTPNFEEAAQLGGIPLRTDVDVKKAGNRLLKAGAEAFLITGGDREGGIKRDCLLFRQNSGNIALHWYEHEFVASRNTHGTGCTLSSAITAFLAKGMTLASAVAAGIAYTHNLIRQSVSFKTGNGSGSLDHFFNYRA
jgi:hydroxymethylpyrimidine/phosphomethylpyrimidine kinase